MENENLDWMSRLATSAMGVYANLVDDPTGPETLGTLLGVLIVFLAAWGGGMVVARATRRVRRWRSDPVTEQTTSLCRSLMQHLRQTSKWRLGHNGAQLTYMDGKLMVIDAISQQLLLNTDGWNDVAKVLRPSEQKAIKPMIKALLDHAISAELLGTHSQFEDEVVVSTAAAEKLDKQPIPIAKTAAAQAAVPPSRKPASAPPKNSLATLRADDDYTLRAGDLLQFVNQLELSSSRQLAPVPVFFKDKDGKLAHTKRIQFLATAKDLYEEDGDQLIGPCIVVQRD